MQDVKDICPVGDGLRTAEAGLHGLLLRLDFGADLLQAKGDRKGDVLLQGFFTWRGFAA